MHTAEGSAGFQENFLHMAGKPLANGMQPMVTSVRGLFQLLTDHKGIQAMVAIARRTVTDRCHPFGLQRRCEPFRDAEEAWLWTMAALIARREGARYAANQGKVVRPCEPDDVVKCLDALYRRRRIDLVHARILRIWGERQASPNPAIASERCDWRLWREALDRLEWPLRVKGIVG
jgi:hypothetical protein